MTKFGGGNVMVWAVISEKGVGKLLRVDNKMNSKQYIKTLRDGLLETFNILSLDIREYVFMHDNASCHTSKDVKTYLKDQNINVLKWPPNSPDMNIIENVWNYIEKRIRLSDSCYNTKDMLFSKIEEEWYKIPLEYIKNLYKSLLTRINILKRENGKNTKY